ncbi:MAG: DEAD/DEAH box helicase family protein, partial [Candidatus Manganitrophaceae bacterium]
MPEILGRQPWEKPTSYLIKDETVPTGWREEKTERRPSKLLLISKLRDTVDQWRKDDYPGASEVTKLLFKYWFEEDHEVAGFPAPFRYHFCQREAIETLAYLVEVKDFKDTQQLIKDFARVFKKNLFEDSVTFQETMDGRRQLRRYVPELEKEGIQDLPPKNLGRYAFKMATGSGKTWVMAMAIVWAHFHKKLIPESILSTNFLVVDPNIIVYQRLEKDFGNNKIFYELPLIPPEWRAAWSQNVILRGESGEPDPSGNLFVTNIHQIHESRREEWTPANAIEALLGRKPNKDLSSYERPMLDRLKGLKDLIVLNDEAHHVHDEDLAWSQVLLGVHAALPKGLALWMDFSATPKDQNGMYFPWTIVDYPLAQAVEDRIVKAPIIVTKEDDPKQPSKDPDHITRENLVEKFGYWIEAGVQRWKDHYKIYKKLGAKPVLFIMAEKNVYADTLGQYLWKTNEFGFKESEVLIIHTDNTGEITKSDLEKVREAARDIDRPESKT